MKCGLPRNLACFRLPSIALFLLTITAHQINAQGLVYLDASDDPASSSLHSEPTNLSPLSAISIDGNRVEDNGLWDWDQAFGSAGSIYTAGDTTPSGSALTPEDSTDADDAPELTMTLSGLDNSKTYDVYVVYWSSDTANWSIRAGLTSNPGANQVFNRLGPSGEVGAIDENAVAGIFAGSAVWDTIPFDAPNSSPGNPFQNNDQNMYLGLVGTGISPSSTNIDIYVDDLSRGALEAIEAGSSSSGDRTWFDGLAFIESGTSPFVSALIDRTNGTLSVSNNTGSSLSFDSYSVTSTSGALLSGEWASINGGNPIDGDAWNIVEPSGSPSAAIELSEEESGSNGGATLGDGSTFALGDVWIRNPSEDVQISLTLTDGSILTLIPDYTNGDQAVTGDFDFDGDLDESDYGHLMSNMFASSGVTLAEAYTFGDLTGDLAVTFADHNEFQALFDSANGAGAFEVMLATVSVPEPSSILLVGISMMLLRGSRYERVS